LWRKNGFSTNAHDNIARTSDAATAFAAANAVPTKPNPTIKLIHIGELISQPSIGAMSDDPGDEDEKGIAR
jgi:hypothetical protein